VRRGHVFVRSLFRARYTWACGAIARRAWTIKRGLRFLRYPSVLFFLPFAVSFLFFSFSLSFFSFCEMYDPYLLNVSLRPDAGEKEAGRNDSRV